MYYFVIVIILAIILIYYLNSKRILKNSNYFINNFQKFNIYQIIRDIHNDAVCRVENESIFKFVGGYFDIVQLDSTAEFNETIFSSFKNFIKDNGIEKDLRELDIRSFSLTFSF